MKKIVLLTIMFLCLQADSYALDNKIKVVASFSIIGDMVYQIGGNRVELVTLAGANADTHAYQPAPSDLMTIRSANLIVINGLGLESWINKLVESSGYKGDVVIASDGVEPSRPINSTNLNDIDPHAWQDVSNAIIYVNNIAAALIKTDPANADYYQANAEKYLAQLSELDKWIKIQVSTIPENKRKIVILHNSFTYFTKAYGVEFLPILQNTASDPSAAEMAALIDRIKKEDIHAIFVENITDSRLVQQIEKDSGANSDGTLYTDALSELGGIADTYVKMMRNNVTNMITAITN